MWLRPLNETEPLTGRSGEEEDYRKDLEGLGALCETVLRQDLRLCMS